MITIETANKIIEYVRNLTMNTVYENKIYVEGSYIRAILLKTGYIDKLTFVVEKRHGGNLLATWLAVKTKCYNINKNPILFVNSGANVRFLNHPTFSDIELTFRHASNGKTDKVEATVEEDAFLKDLTIDAVYMNIFNGEFVDPTKCGLNDFENKILRLIRTDNTLLKENPLYLLKLISAASIYDFGFDKETWLNIITNASLIKQIPLDCITKEFNTILLTKKPSIGIKRLYNSGMLGYIMPQLYRLTEMPSDSYNGKIFEHSLNVMDKTKPQIVNRLAGLLHDIGKLKTESKYKSAGNYTNHDIVGATTCQEILHHMGYSNNIVNCVSTVVKNHMKFSQHTNTTIPSTKFLRKFAATMGEYKDVALDVIHANNISHFDFYNMPNQIPLILEKFEEMENEGENVSKIVLPINGNDIMEALNIKKSPLVGQLLKTVKEAYLENPKITKEQCLALIKSV